jgi:glutaredoxin
MIVNLIREGLGRIISLGDHLTRPQAIQRSEQEQADVNKAVDQMSLYQFYACPFCIKTRRIINRLNLPMEYRNAQVPGPVRDELQQQGGKIKVPCLRIEENGDDRWLYESSQIIAYLDQRFGVI